ncbi:glycosyltransferase family 4 protein [soil metagenome]
MRVLQVHTQYRQTGGEDAVVAAEAEMLRGGGHVVELHSLENPTDPIRAASALVCAPWNSRAARDVVEVASTFRADVVHVHNAWFALSPAVFRKVRLAGFPVVATIHNYRLACVNALLYRDGKICEDCMGTFPWRGVTRRCYRNSSLQSAAVAVTIGTHRVLQTWDRDVDAVIALTDFAADRLAISGVARDLIFVKPNVVSDPGGRVTPPSNSTTVLFVGRLTEDKGVMDLLEAWRQAPTGDMELKIVGDGPLLDDVKRAGVDRVSVVGPKPRDAVKDLMLRARCLVLPSRWYEGLPMVLLEALAAGLPTVVPAHGALPEIIGEAGVAYASGNLDALAGTLEMLDSDELVDVRGAQARQRFLEAFSSDVGLSLLEGVYERAINARRV